jgi:hypothetical protein
LTNVFLKRIHLPHRIHSTSTATARAATATTGALPNAPLLKKRRGHFPIASSNSQVEIDWESNTYMTLFSLVLHKFNVEIVN